MDSSPSPQMRKAPTKPARVSCGRWILHAAFLLTAKDAPVLTLTVLAAYTADLILQLRWASREARHRRWSLTALRAWKIALALALVLVASEVAWMQARGDDGKPALMPPSPVFCFAKDLALGLLAFMSTLTLPEGMIAGIDGRTLRRDLELASRNDETLLSPASLPRGSGMRSVAHASVMKVDSTADTEQFVEKDSM
ncbi:hypothetical protein H9P43_002777 [Blastocladiella emersonii ATCC 22665]|nr:hypothetical protein H9P43_002777 [Blastocladiella emersonii ATCC 22665]